MDHRFAAIENRLEKIEEKQDKILEEITANTVINTRNTASLEDHVARSNALQEELRIVKEEIKPIQNHVAMLNGALKLVGVIALLLTASAALVTLLHGLGVSI